MQIIDGRVLAEKIKDKIVKEITDGRQGLNLVNCPRPNLAIVLVGNRADSELYVSLKEKEAKKCGIDTHLYRCGEDVSENELLDLIDYLNKDDLIDAILLQMPLPENLDTDKIIRAIDPAKDVDGFHPDNINIILNYCEYTCPPELQRRRVLPPVFDAVWEILKSIKYDLSGEQVCLVSNSDIFGKSLAKALECRGARVEVASAADSDLDEKTKRANLLITAVGKPRLIKREMVKDGAVVIDIGIIKEGDKISGDVDFANVADKTSFITPVPGGIGPLTIACALRNTLEFYKRRHK